jgi:hypothetical protein
MDHGTVVQATAGGRMREMKPEALVELLGAVKGAQRRADNHG